MELILTGMPEDLLYVSEDKKIKSTRFCKVNANTDIENEEIIDVTVMSSSEDGNHPFFDKFMGSVIRITVETI